MNHNIDNTSCAIYCINIEQEVGPYYLPEPCYSLGFQRKEFFKNAFVLQASCSCLQIFMLIKLLHV